ncbi:polysaccharide pyruvyl transferase family protein [Pluralibacter gergoviae]|nr:polysaccharide pyruvyl transferase family protein [Pluralibacter gergoviae]
MNKIIIVNEICSDNIGDHAINMGVTQALNRYGIETDSYGFDAKIKNVSLETISKKNFFSLTIFLRWVKNKTVKNNKAYRYLLWLLRNVIRTIKITKQNKNGRIIIGGGQLIQSGGTFPIAMYTWIQVSKLFNLDIYIVGVGCAEKFNGLDSFLYKSSLKHAKKIYVRDHSSISKLEKNFNIKAAFIPDLAYALYDEPVYRTPKDNVAIIGCTAYYVYMKNVKELNSAKYMEFDEYLQFWVQIILKYCGEGHILMISTTVEDLYFSKLVYDTIRAINSDLLVKIDFVNTMVTLNEYINFVKKAKVVLSGRMHSLILGHIAGCNSIPYNINKKVEIFAEEYLKTNASEIAARLDLNLKEIFNIHHNCELKTNADI